MAAWQEADDGAWRFARITDDQNEALFDEVDVDLSLPPAPRPEDWVTEWVEVLALLDRYPWIRLHRLDMHPAFVEQVRAAMECAARKHG